MMFIKVKGPAPDPKVPRQVQLVLAKSLEVYDEDGTLTTHGQGIAETYAQEWIGGNRRFDLERVHPDLQELFYDIRLDPELAAQHAE